MTSGTTDPWSPAYRPTAHHDDYRPTAHDDAVPEPERFVDYTAAMNYYAGPFCCSDYSCPANNDPTARCVNYEDPFASTSRYPESWTDEDIEAYEAEELAASLIAEARHDALLAVERINTIGADLIGTSTTAQLHQPPRR